MTVFEFVEIKKELIATLEGGTADTGALVTDVKYAEGTVRSRKDGDYRKQGGKWIKIYSGEGRGASLAVTHAVKKIKAAQSVDELMDLVNANISRFYDKNGKLLPVVARLRDAVNESKTRINSAKKESEKKESEKQTQKPKSRFPIRTPEERAEIARKEALKEYKDKERKRIKSIQNAVDYVKKNYGVDIPDSIITENGRRGFSIKTDSKTLTKQQQRDISRALEEMRVKGILGEHAYNGGLGTFYAFPKKAPFPSELQEKTQKVKTTSDEDKKQFGL